MASISSAGIGSGLDVSGLINQIMAVEAQPLKALDTKEAVYQAKLTAFGTLKSAVGSLQTAARSLKSATLYGAMAAKSSDSTVIAATANTAAQSGTYSIEVVKKAQAQAISSQAFASITADQAAANGKLKIELGTFSGGSFVADPDKTPKTIEIDQASSSLEDIRDAINNANAGVRASLVYVGAEGYKLTLTSSNPGAKSAIKLTAMDANDVVLNDNTGLAKLSFDPTVDKVANPNGANQFDINVAAQDAHLKIDGLDVYRSTNSVSDAITGVTLNLANTGTTTLTVSKDSSSAKSALDSFVKAYNEINTQLRGMTAYDAANKKAAILTGDSGARGLQNAMREMIAYSRSSAGGPSSLSDLGIALQRDGSLSFNTTKFEEAMSSSSTAVKDLMTTTTTSAPGLAVRMTTALDGILSNSGLLASRTEGLTRSIADIGDRREVLNRRLTQIESRYRAQFTALDTLVSSMKKTSDYLTQQLANLPSSSG